MTTEHLIFVEYADGDIDEFEGLIDYEGELVVIYDDEVTHHINRRHTRAVHIHPITEEF
ncbi:hypothetical protein [Streptomyces vinaceus]|uniref:hypothetical protein n=1 Tax=Streptomyces vinaceus TaxID=1960 RepID=UPI0036A2080E